MTCLLEVTSGVELNGQLIVGYSNLALSVRVRLLRQRKCLF